MEIYDVVKKLTGRIEPIADAAIDGDRYENLVEVCSLLYDLISDVKHVALQKDSAYGSVRTAAIKAMYELETIREELNEL